MCRAPKTPGHLRRRWQGRTMDEAQGGIPGGEADRAAQAVEGSWAAYYAGTRGNPPWPLLVRAVAMVPAPGDALDLGCGAGNETRFLLDSGFRVTAVDADSNAVNALRHLAGERLRVVQSTFAD